MIIFDCPNCTKEVVLGSDTTGVYQCPNCNMNIEYLSGNELTVSEKKTHSNTGSLVSGGVFKGWRAFGYRPKRNLSPNDEKLSMFDKIFILLLLCVIIGFLVGMTKISNGVCFLALIPIVIWVALHYFNDFMIKKRWFLVARCVGEYALWDGRNMFAIPLNHNRTLFISSEKIRQIVVHNGPGAVSSGYGGMVDLFVSGKNGHIKFGDLKCKTEFVNLLTQVTGIIPKSKFHKELSDGGGGGGD